MSLPDKVMNIKGLHHPKRGGEMVIKNSNYLNQKLKRKTSLCWCIPKAHLSYLLNTPDR